jgi:hypothetical protein
MPSIRTDNVFKKFLIVSLKAAILTATFSRCKNLFAYGPGLQINLLPGAGPGLPF